MSNADNEVTEAEVTAALDAYWKSGYGARQHMRASLEAAREARNA